MFGIDFIRMLKPCKWRYKQPLDDGVEHFGFIAQEVDKIASHKDYGFVILQDGGLYALKLSEFIGPIVKSIQELDARISAIEEMLEFCELTESDNMGDN